MSRSFNDSLAQDLETVFFNTNEFAERVTLRRGQLTETGIAAICLSPAGVLTDEEAAVTSFEQLDFDIIATDYAIRGEVLEPRKSDEITRSGGRVYRVMSLPGSQCFERINTDGTILRVHTKRVS